jgi:exo-beta-1,3-glucanase (GH17 family)
MPIINLLKDQHLSKRVTLFWPTVIHFWEGIDNEDAAYSVQRMYELTKAKAQGKKVIITETGWPRQRGKVLAKPHPTEENAMKFFINIQKVVRRRRILSYSIFHLLTNPGKWLMKVKLVLSGALWDKNEKSKI